jgi:hypothetical protein
VTRLGEFWTIVFAHCEIVYFGECFENCGRGPDF